MFLTTGFRSLRREVVLLSCQFFVNKSLTILPKIVIPKIMPVTIARKIARKRVNLKTRKKRGKRSAQTMIVRQPVAKSLVSNIQVLLPVFPFSGVSSGL
jgi:hypothetical protein